MAVIDLSTPRRRKPWLLTLVGFVTVAGMIAMPLIAGPPDAEKMPDFVRFIGHFHPVLLHLPIGVFYLILFQELAAMFARRGHEPQPTSMFPSFFGAASSIAAVLAGFCLYHGGIEYKGNALAERHLWAGISFAVGAVMSYVVKAWTGALTANPAYYRLLLCASVGVMTWASHDGGSITHGEPYLTEYAPEPLRKIMGLPPRQSKPADIPAKPAAEQQVYADIVAPILADRCQQCHKETKAKGKFRMDTYELLVKGGKEGPGIEPGNSAKSNILIRAQLPVDDEDRMPPDEKPGLGAPELAVIKWWIDNGADPKKTLGDFEVPAAVKEALANLSPHKSSDDAPEIGDAGKAPHGPSASLPDDALKASVAAITKEFPGALAFESQTSSLLTFTAVSMRGNFDDAGFKKLATVTPQLVTVDLSATKITDATVAQLAPAKSLRMVRLSETAVTDAAIDTLVKMPSLESINLYGTKVTDSGVSKLVALPNLKKLYLWQTAVTPEAVKALKEKLPACDIVTGAGT